MWHVLGERRGAYRALVGKHENVANFKGKRILKNKKQLFWNTLQQKL
jgi:hypothetical protein